MPVNLALSRGRLYHFYMKRAASLFLFLLLPLLACSEPDRPTISLYLAVQRGDLDQIERHIHWGADINRPDVDGRMPLHVAAEKGRVVVVKLLLKQGADIDARDRDGHSPLYAAVMAGRTQVAQYLIKLNAPFDADYLLSEAVRNQVQDRDVIDLLLDSGADIDHISDLDGNTPLILAIREQNRILTKLLVSRGADVNLAGKSGEMPLAVAQQTGNPEIIRLLERNGARK